MLRLESAGDRDSASFDFLCERDSTSAQGFPFERLSLADNSPCLLSWRMEGPMRIAARSDLFSGGEPVQSFDADCAKEDLDILRVQSDVLRAPLRQVFPQDRGNEELPGSRVGRLSGADTVCAIKNGGWKTRWVIPADSAWRQSCQESPILRTGVC